MKKIKSLMLFALVFLLFSCRTELEVDSHSDSHNQSKNSSKIKFQQFQSETQIKDFKAFLNIDSDVVSKKSNLLLAFKIDSANINKLAFNDRQTYSFRAYNIFGSPENIYNVLYYKGITKWEFSLLKIIRNSQNKTEKIIPIYDSSVGEISVAESSVLGKNSCMTEVYFTEFHCTCPPSWKSCDLCTECVTESHSMVITDCGGDGSGNPIFNTSPSGLPITYPVNYFHDVSNPPSYNPPPQNPSPYYFDPNIPPTIDAGYVRAVRSDNFWFQLDNNGKYWGQQHPDMYNNLLENYLNNYTIPNNSNNLQFHNWAISFLNENPTTTWTQFENSILYNKNLYEDYTLTSTDEDNNIDAGFDTMVYTDFNPQQQGWATILNVININNFVGWGYPGIKRNCMDYAKAQISKIGYQISNYGATGQTFQIFREQTGVNNTNLVAGLSYLKYALSNGIPVIVGVHDAPGHPGNADQTTDHFVVIVGMGSDSNGNYFTFYDNASGNANLGASPNNKLYYNMSTGLISGTSDTPFAHGLTYILTQIRKSKLK